jgi:L-gulonate 5-dehydrogenase
VNFCLIGLHWPGGYAELCLAPERNIHRIPPGLDPVTASFAEPLTIGIHACRRGEVAAGEYCLVLGAGPIGLAILEVAKLRGARVVVTDLNEERLAFARELGAETLKADDKLVATVLEQTNREGADVVIEATGSVQAVQSTIELVASGGRIVIVGLVKKGVGVTLPGLDFTRKEVNLLGSRNSVNCFPEAIALLASGAVKYPRVATKIPMWDGVPVFAKLHARESGGIAQRRAGDGIVARVCNLPYRRFAIGRVWKIRARINWRGACGLQTRDTADWKSALRVVLPENAGRQIE